MKKFLTLAALFFFFLSDNCFAQQIKRPLASGTYYSDSAEILAAEIERFLEWAEITENNKDILALISPHAGYEYCGSVVAYGYKAIKGRPIHTVVIIGPSHYEYFDGVSVYPQGAWQTPLGNVPVDTELAGALIQGHRKISFYEPAFSKEHSVEVEIPFLQIVLDDFKIVPVVMGNFSYDNCQMLAQVLFENIKDREGVLIIASTDMSHYHPYDEACGIDNLTIEELKKFDPESLYSKLASKESEFCGAAAVVTTLLYAKKQGAMDIEIMKYANSGDVTGNKSRVVGYLSAVIYAPLIRNSISNETEPREEQMLNKNKETLNEGQKRRLLEIARQTIEAYVNKGERLDITEDDPFLLKNMGAFVTIHKQGALRGCIGNIVAHQALYLTVRDMAIEATKDPRFPPLSADELKDIDIEISVLTQPQRLKSADAIEMGRHGVIVKRGASSGVFLPQVARDTGWSREEFLSNLCAHKAGLSPNAWKDEETELYSFTAQVFGEKDSR